MTESSTPTNLDTIKSVADFIVARSVSGTVVTIIHNNTTTYTKAQKAQLYIGAYLIGSMAAKAAKAHTHEMIDTAAKAIEEVKGEYKNWKSEKDSKNA